MDCSYTARFQPVSHSKRITTLPHIHPFIHPFIHTPTAVSTMQGRQPAGQGDTLIGGAGESNQQPSAYKSNPGAVFPLSRLHRVGPTHSQKEHILLHYISHNATGHYRQTHPARWHGNHSLQVPPLHRAVCEHLGDITSGAFPLQQ